MVSNFTSIISPISSRLKIGAIAISPDKKESFSLTLSTLDGSSYEEGKISFFVKNELIEKAYEDTLEIKNKKSETKKALFNFQKQRFKDVIFKRRSIREFTKQSI